jgi:O-antigen/teichoic acid export membrane protein
VATDARVADRQESPAAALRSLGFAQAVALLAALGGATVYASRLDAQTFAHWGMALLLARAGQMLLDGGLRVALLRTTDWPAASVLQRLQSHTVLAAGVGVALLALLLAGLHRAFGLDAHAALLLTACAAAYWLCHPWAWLASARLERHGRLASVGRAEAAATLVEFALPALLMLASCPALPALAAACGGGRLLRVLWLRHAASQLPAPTDAGSDESAGRLVRDGLGFQLVVGISLLRDNVHLWLLAPLAGDRGTGQFAFALLAGQLATQLFVPVVTRWLLPQLPARTTAQRSALVQQSLLWVSIPVLPLLATSALLMGWLDAVLWSHQWQLAAQLMPWLALRLALGLPVALLGTWMLVERSPQQAARWHARWTLLECALALVGLWIAGAQGMAIASAFSLLPGLWWFLQACLPGHALAERLRLALVLLAPLVRPSMMVALLIGSAAIYWQTPWLLILLPCAWLCESRLLAAWRRRPQSVLRMHG